MTRFPQTADLLVEDFRAWLERNPNLRFNTGLVCKTCPIAVWLSRIAGEEILINGLYYNGILQNDSNSPLPAWASKFIRYYDIYRINTDTTPGALKALEMSVVK